MIPCASVLPAGSILEHTQNLTFEHFGYGNSIDKRILNVNINTRDGALYRNITKTPNTQTASSSGLLANLPLEILQAVILQLDIWSVTRFRAVNRQTFSTIDQNLQYAHIKKWTPHVLFALLKTGAASMISLNSLFRNIDASNCASCGDFAPFLYLLTCERVCSICFSSKPQYLPLTQTEIKRRFQIPAKTLQLLPKLHSLPGTYSDESKVWRRRVTLFDRTAVEMVAYGLESIGFNQKTDASGLGELDHLGANPYRFMAIIHVAWFDREHEKLERGLSCRSCQDSSCLRDFGIDGDTGGDGYTEEDVEEDVHANAETDIVEVDDGNVNKDRRQMSRRFDWRTLYTTVGFIEHVRFCKGSRALLLSLQRGETH